MSASDIDRSRLRAWTRRQADTYRNGGDQPLEGYVQLGGIYALSTAAATLLARRLGRRPGAFSPWDVTLLAAATHRLSRTLAKDPVTSPIRAPFTVFDGVSAPSELAERVRGHGLQHSVGELLTCPMCLAQWVATGFSFGLVFAPMPTRIAMATFTAVAGADFLHYVYAWLQQLAE